MDEKARTYPGRIVEIAEIPGGDWRDEIDEVRRDISELDPEDDGYDDALAKLRAELRRLRSLPPKEARTMGVVTSYTVPELWAVLNPAQRRRYLLAADIRVIVGKTSEGEIIRELQGDLSELRRIGWPDLESPDTDAPLLAGPDALAWLEAVAERRT